MKVITYYRSDVTVLRWVAWGTDGEGIAVRLGATKPHSAGYASGSDYRACRGRSSGCGARGPSSVVFPRRYKTPDLS